VAGLCSGDLVFLYIVGVKTVAIVVGAAGATTGATKAGKVLKNVIGRGI